MSEWFETLEGIREKAWHLLGQGAEDSRSAMHLAALATVGLGGGGEARRGVLLGARAADGTLEVQTDRASRKVDELQGTPLATLLFWDQETSVQIRARVRIDVLTGDAVEDRWQKLPDAARVNYGGQPAPSTPLDDPARYRETAERDRFAVLLGEVSSLDIVHLGDVHRRALFERKDGFAGMWLAP